MLIEIEEIKKENLNLFGYKESMLELDLRGYLIQSLFMLLTYLGLNWIEKF